MLRRTAARALRAHGGLICSCLPCGRPRSLADATLAEYNRSHDEMLKAALEAIEARANELDAEMDAAEAVAAELVPAVPTLLPPSVR